MCDAGSQVGADARGRTGCCGRVRSWIGQGKCCSAWLWLFAAILRGTAFIVTGSRASSSRDDRLPPDGTACHGKAVAVALAGKLFDQPSVLHRVELGRDCSASVPVRAAAILD